VTGSAIVSQPQLTADIARTWMERWDLQQQGYIPDREERFTAMIDAVQAGAGRPDPLVLDLGCGPGSLAARLRGRMPGATVVAVDSDPLLLALGRACHGGTGLRFLDLDLRTRDWPRALGPDGERPLDAAISSTALHWLRDTELRDLYADMRGMLRPGGLLLNGDHFDEDESAAPTLYRLGRTLVEREGGRRFPGGAPEDWGQWWDTVSREPALAAEVAERARRRESDRHDWPESLLLDTHVAALRAAGFTEIGTLWQRGECRVLCAVAP
jgi:SAM-dependent methyltransferase